MKAFKDYDTTKSYTEVPKLPKGGYVVKILAVEIVQYTSGDCLKLSCDIVEGEYAKFFRQRYDANTKEDKAWPCNLLLNIPTDDGSERDGWTKRRFKTAIEAVEESNQGFHWDWDERKLRGMIAGGLFNEREYEYNGEIRKATNLAALCPVELVRSGKYTLPKDKLLTRTAEADPYNDPAARTGFVNIPDGVDDDALPFA